MDIFFFNPWWKGTGVPKTLVGRRRGIFYKVKDFLTLRQILLFTGLRRAGKTTLMFQIIDELLKRKVNPFNILYFSFDEQQLQLDDILKTYEIQVLKKPFSSENIFLFFDEIHKPLL